MRLKTSLLICAISTALPLAAFAQTSSNGGIVRGAAAAYADYQGQVSDIRAKPLGGADQLDKALDTFGAQNAGQLSNGWISYSAMVAAQNKEFASSVRDIDSFYGRDRVLTGMRNDVAYARSLKGGESALQTALAVNSQDSSRISSAAAFVKEQAYKLQDIAWGKVRLKDAGGTANKLKIDAKATRPIAETAQKFFAGPDLNVVLASASNGSETSVWDKVSLITASAPAAAIASIAPSTAAPQTYRVDPKREGTADRIVTLAAMHVLDAEKGNADDVKAAMKDKPTYDCIDWSQLQLQACVSAAYTRADLSFCLAQHAIGDAGQCFAGVTR
ncbi:MAG: hypothetical protein GC155_11945 [Alphaproteobacteria bacterium]|nr:hypothetical protein [Alphaproteobacteria bacterium]